MGNNELWKIQKGFIAGYTEDTDLMQRIIRYKFKNKWEIMAEYHDMLRKRFAVQFKIPIEQKRSAERMFNVKVG